MNLVEEPEQEILSQGPKIQALRDEISPLKREDVKSDIKANKKQQENYSSENERKEKYYSASTRKTYLAGLPFGYTGQFESTVHSLGLLLYYAGGMSEPKSIGLLEQLGVNISKGKISNLLSKETA